MTPWIVACQAPLSFTISWSLLRFMSIESMMLSKHLILCLLFLLLPSIFPSIRVFSSELSLHIRWPKYWSFSFSISPSNQYTGFIFFKIDQFDVPAVQGTLKSLFQHHSSRQTEIECFWQPHGMVDHIRLFWIERGKGDIQRGKGTLM